MASFACFRIIKITRACRLRSNCYPSFVSSTLLPLGSAKACHRGEKTQQHDWRMPTPTSLCRTFDLLKPWKKSSPRTLTQFRACVHSMNEIFSSFIREAMQQVRKSACCFVGEWERAKIRERELFYGVAGKFHEKRTLCASSEEKIVFRESCCHAENAESLCCVESEKLSACSALSPPSKPASVMIFSSWEEMRERERVENWAEHRQFFLEFAIIIIKAKKKRRENFSHTEGKN